MNSTLDIKVITGLGLVSTLGDGVIQSCASARAGINSIQELDDYKIFDNETSELEPALGYPVIRLTEGYSGLGRLIRLGVAALDDLIANSNLQESDFSRTGLFLNLSSGYLITESEKRDRIEVNKRDDGLPYEMDFRKYEYKENLISQITKFSGINIPEENQFVCFGDHAGIVSVVMVAMEQLETQTLDRAIIGGVDTLLEPDLLDMFVKLKVMKTANNPNGFIPGEAASFFIMERYETAKKNNSTIQGIIGNPSFKKDEKHRFSEIPSTGIALADCITMTLEKSEKAGDQPGLMIGHLNGESARAMEWGNALVQLSLKHSIKDLPIWIPAESFGEIGAASGAAAVCMAIRGFQRKYTGSDNVLLWISNDNGDKASLLLKKFLWN